MNYQKTEVIAIVKENGKTIMQQAIDKARKTMNDDLGGPFGAAIINENGTVLAVTSNSVLSDNDPTAHAEVNAIRAATKKIGSYDLSGCVLYTTSYPCPMCLGAILWANIRTIIHGCRPEDADAIGFRDGFMYDFIKGDCEDENILVIKEKHREDCLALFKEYKDSNKTLY